LAWLAHWWCCGRKNTVIGVNNGIATSLPALVFDGHRRDGAVQRTLFGWVTLQNRESTLAIRPIAQNTSVPDGFSIWHHLDANGIHFKSITPLNDTLLIKFESSAQSAAAKCWTEHSLTATSSRYRMTTARPLPGFRVYAIPPIDSADPPGF
jgi:hypothetical protein